MASEEHDPREAPPPASAPDEGGRPTTKTSRRRRSPLWLLLILVVLAAGGYGGYLYIREQMQYVSTDNAMVMGSLVQLGSLNAGRIDSMAVDIGQHVTAGEQVVTVTIPAEVTTTGSGAPKMGFRYTQDQSAPVFSPIDGIVVARNANPGDTVAAGQTVLTLINPRNLWVQANVDETQIARVRPGQPVQVTVDALGKTLPGHVYAVNDATAATFSLLPQNNTQGNYTKVTQVVPVKISVDYGDDPLVLGSSAEVRIRVQN